MLFCDGEATQASEEPGLGVEGRGAKTFTALLFHYSVLDSSDDMAVA